MLFNTNNWTSVICLHIVEWSNSSFWPIDGTFIQCSYCPAEGLDDVFHSLLFLWNNSEKNWQIDCLIDKNIIFHCWLLQYLRLLVQSKGWVILWIDSLLIYKPKRNWKEQTNFGRKHWTPKYSRLLSKDPNCENRLDCFK